VKSTITSSPFLSSDRKVFNVMCQVILALLPGIGLYIWFYGWGVVTNITLGVISALSWELVMLVIRQRPVLPYITDGSVLVTALLLVLAMPPMSPWWLIVTGTFFAVVVAKHLYGGLGYNPLNPAMAAYAVLLISFPKLMSLWPLPLSLSSIHLNFADTVRWVMLGIPPGSENLDSLTGATPLDTLRTGIRMGINVSDIEKNAIFGWVAGRELEWISMAYAAGGLWLIYKRLVQWQIPAAILVTLLTLSSAFYVFSSQSAIDPLMQLAGGATLLCAFFIATDPVTAAATPAGRWIFGAGIGLIIFAIRTWGGYPDGVAFAVILMNLCVPLLDQYTVPKAFGARRDVN
jgi:electron transport complex protein RnfD